MTSSPPSGGPTARNFIRLGSVLVGCLLFGMAVGYLVDVLAGTTPLFLLVGLALGIVAACGWTYRTVRDYLNQ